MVFRPGVRRVNNALVFKLDWIGLVKYLDSSLCEDLVLLEDAIPGSLVGDVEEGDSFDGSHCAGWWGVWDSGCSAGREEAAGLFRKDCRF